MIECTSLQPNKKLNINQSLPFLFQSMLAFSALKKLLLASGISKLGY
jgi:hypothetical protein